MRMSIFFSLFVFFLECFPIVSGRSLQSPASWCLIFHTNISSSTGDSSIVLNVTRAWSPIGADHYYSLVSQNFFNVAPSVFFRVVPQFVVQFGISGSPAENSKWNNSINDDPVKISNLKRTVSYATAGPNTRTTQIFINWANNSFLDSQGFSPFAVVVSGFELSEAIVNPTPGNTNGIDQTSYMNLGNPWLAQHYQGLNFILKAEIGSKCPIKENEMPEEIKSIEENIQLNNQKKLNEEKLHLATVQKK